MSILRLLLNAVTYLFRSLVALTSRKPTLELPQPSVVDDKPAIPATTPTDDCHPAGHDGGSSGRADPNRQGTFIITDIYPLDLGPNPPFHVLPGKVLNGKLEIVGAIVKASQGIGWGTSNEDWFKRSWKKVKEVGGERYGVDWFRGAYHFLSFGRDGAQQADYFLRLVDEAGGWDNGDIMPIVDAEEGGQGGFSGGEKLSDIKDPAKRLRLANKVIDCVSKFADRVKEKTGHRVMLYGRGIMRDLHIKNRMNCDTVMNPAWTRTMPSMEKYGWPLADVSLWQLCGDGVVAAEGFPSEIPDWGKEDYSVYVDGSKKTDLVSLRRRILTRPR